MDVSWSKPGKRGAARKGGGFNSRRFELLTRRLATHTNVVTHAERVILDFLPAVTVDILDGSQSANDGKYTLALEYKVVTG